MDYFNWKDYLENYPDLKRSGIDNSKKAERHYLIHGKKEGRTYKRINEIEPLKLTIITPCSRPENIKFIELNFDYIEEWIIVYDGKSVQDFEKINNPKVKQYIHFVEGSVYGNAQRNYGISKVTNENTFIYFLDDDNIIHPELYNLKLNKEYFYTFDQLNDTKLRKGNNIKVNFIDTAMFLCYYPMIKNIKWENVRNADGLFIERVHKLHSKNWNYVNKTLCYYNKIKVI